MRVPAGFALAQSARQPSVATSGARQGKGQHGVLDDNVGVGWGKARAIPTTTIHTPPTFNNLASPGARRARAWSGHRRVANQGALCVARDGGRPYCAGAGRHPHPAHVHAAVGHWAVGRRGRGSRPVATTRDACAGFSGRHHAAASQGHGHPGGRGAATSPNAVQAREGEVWRWDSGRRGRCRRNCPTTIFPTSLATRATGTNLRRAACTSRWPQLRAPGASLSPPAPCLSQPGMTSLTAYARRSRPSGWPLPKREPCVWWWQDGGSWTVSKPWVASGEGRAALSQDRPHTGPRGFCLTV